MARVIALAQNVTPHFQQAEVTRIVVVWGCALALIMAGTALPF